MTSDWRKDLKALYMPPTNKVVVVKVPRMKYLMVDGTGDPNKGMQPHMEALYGIAYGLKFSLKKKDPTKDFRVFPLEGLWWMKGIEGLDQNAKGEWQWTLMIAQPNFVTEKMVDDVRAQAQKKKDNPLLAQVRLEELDEGDCAQIMHIGPYSQEGPNIVKVHEHIASLGKKPKGKHHEIYMSDPRRVPPEKWKTVIRQPFA